MSGAELMKLRELVVTHEVTLESLTDWSTRLLAAVLAHVRTSALFPAIFFGGGGILRVPMVRMLRLVHLIRVAQLVCSSQLH